jgi:CheY-like chemotaxis protein
MNILLVDDTQDHLELLSEFVRELRPQATIHSLQNATELTQYLQATPVDLVMVDLLMPQMNGFDLVRQVREMGQWPNLPIVAVSGLRESGQQQRLQEAGFNDYVNKPYDFSDLTRVLDRHLPQLQRHVPYTGPGPEAIP